MFGDLAQWAADIMAAFGPFGLAFLLLVENLFPPIPSEVILPLAGFLVGRGELGFVSALAGSTTGSLAGALVLYALGRRGGRPLVLRHGRLLRVTERDLERAEGWFDRYGDWIVLLGRVVPLARSVVSIPAGVLEMPLWKFMLLTVLGSAAWNALLIGAGWILGANWERVSDVVGVYSNAVLVTVLAVLAVTAGIFAIRRTNRQR